MSKHILSPSGISTFRSCPKKFYWHYIERIERLGTVEDPNLLLGHTFHHLLETGETEVPVGVNLTEKEKIMIEASAEYFKGEYNLDEGETLKEFELEVDFFDNSYRGLIDLVQLSDDGDTLIDYKFVSSLTYAKTYAYGDQAKLYPILYELQTGRKVKEMKFICISKPTIRLKQKEEVHEYFDRVKEWYGVGNKIEFVDVEISQRMKDEIQLDLHFIQHMIDNGIFYKNYGNCMSYGKECPFLPLCRGDENAMDLYVPREER